MSSLNTGLYPVRFYNKPTNWGGGISRGTWHLTHNTQHLTHESWLMVQDTWHMENDTWYMTHGIWHMTHMPLLSTPFYRVGWFSQDKSLHLDGTAYLPSPAKQQWLLHQWCNLKIQQDLELFRPVYQNLFYFGQRCKHSLQKKLLDHFINQFITTVFEEQPLILSRVC